MSKSSSSSLVYQNILSTCVLHSDQPDETIDDEAPIVVEMNQQFSSPGSTVNLSGQDLSDWISMQSLCARLSRSDNAKSIIYLDHCNLGRHGAAIVSRSFTHVLIRAGNYVAKWLPLMHQNGRIIVLSMINNDIGPDGAAAVATMLRVNTSLRELNLRFNSLKSDGAQYLASALYVNNSLRFLCVSGNELCGIDNTGEQGYDLTGISALCRALYVNTRLKTLKIAENDIGNDGAKHLADALRENKCLSVLDIHGNSLFNVLEEEIIDEGEESLKAMESKSLQPDDEEKKSSSQNNDTPPMRNNNQNNPETTPQSSTKDEKINGRNIENSQHEDLEKHVELKYELTGFEGGGSLLTAIGESKYLTSVDISWNELGPKGAILFASSLLNNSYLTYLDIHGNFIGDDGVSALCLFLKGDSCKLNILYMQRVGMTTCGALLVAEVLSINKTLTKLNLAHNIIEATGAYKIAFSLRSNSTLKDLNLRNCNICSEGISHLANMLQYNRSLTILNLSNNDIEDDGAIAISVTLSLNPTLETLDLSNYQWNNLFSMDGDDTPLATSTHPKKPLPPSGATPTPTLTTGPSPTSRSIKPHKIKRIGESGMEALAQAITGNIRLSQLILNGHDLSAKMCQDLLNAMNESRVCTIIADFKSYKWRQDEVLLAMKVERELLSSCYTPKSLRVHLCGQSNSKKQHMLHGWYENQQLPFWTSLFGTSEKMKECYGVEILQLSLQNKVADVNFWCYDGLNQLHELHRLHLRATPLSVAMIAVSSVGLTGQCRSAAQVAVEVISWIRLLITFGHQTRDIAIIITNGVLFDQAWQGVDPCCVGVPPSLDDINQSRSSVDYSTVSSEKKDDELTAPESTHTLGTTSFTKPLTSLEPQTLDDSNNVSTHHRRFHNNSPTFATSPSFSSSSSSQFKQVPSEEQTPSSTHKTEADIRRKFEESIHEQISLALGWKRTPQLFCWDEGENGPLPLKVDQWLTDRYKSLSQHVQVPNICSIIREQCLPILRNNQQLQVVSMDQLLKHCKQHVKCLQLVELRQACQWLHLLGDIVIYDTVELDSYEIDMWNYLRIKDSTHQLDDQEGLQSNHTNISTAATTSAFTTNANAATSTATATGSLTTATSTISEGKNPENEMKTEINYKLKIIESKRLKIQIDLELMKKQAPKRNCKIILNPHWFNRHILVGFILNQQLDFHLRPGGGGSGVGGVGGSGGMGAGAAGGVGGLTSPLLPTTQPWCNHEYKFTFQQIYDYIFPYLKQLNNNITITELLIALEVQRIGVILPSISSFCLPSRLQGNKFKWLSERQVTKMSLSQYNGYGSRNNNELSTITSAIGRRIKAKHPYIFPPSTFPCLQSHILHNWITEKDNSWKYYRVVLWERGIGITIEQPPLMKSQKMKKYYGSSNAATPPPPPQQQPSSTSSSSTSSSSTSSSSISSDEKIPSSPSHSQSPSSSGESSDTTQSDSNKSEDENNGNPNINNKDFPVGSGAGFICILIEMTSKSTQPDWSQNPDSLIDIMIWGEGQCDNSQLPLILNQFIQLVYSSCQLVCQGALRSEGASVDALMPPLINWLKVSYLRPGCFLHTLASNTNERNCGEYLEDYDVNDPPEAPILVQCHHLQPRLIKSHLLHGYILNESPGQGKGLLRSIFSSLERCIEIINQQENNIFPNTSTNTSGTNAGAGAVGGTSVNNSTMVMFNSETNYSMEDAFYDIQSNIIASE